MKAPPMTVVRAVADRFGKGQAGRWRASVAATAAGGAVGVTVYKVLRGDK